MSRFQGNALIGQSGGPTAVINQSLVGVVEACLASPDIHNVYGALNGVQGILEERLIDLSLESPDDLERVAQSPGAALRSVRLKPDRAQCERIVQVLKAHDVRFVFYIGGNDTAETSHLINTLADEADHDVRLIHVPKTVDNDLEVTDHCPGYPSAARFVAQAFLGDDLDNRSLGGVKLNVLMGRHAGWLTAASALARGGPGDAPHLIYLPEVDFDLDAFTHDVKRCLERLGRCVVALSEGVHTADGKLVLEGQETDSHGNVQLSGTGALGDYLAARLKAALPPGARVRADTFGYMQRSFFGVVSEQDAREARAVGHAAVRAATEQGIDEGSIVILRDEQNGHYVPRYDVTNLQSVAQRTKVMPPEFLAGSNDVTPAFLDWLRPLVGELPRPGRLSDFPVPRQLRPLGEG